MSLRATPYILDHVTWYFFLLLYTTVLLVRTLWIKYRSLDISFGQISVHWGFNSPSLVNYITHHNIIRRLQLGIFHWLTWAWSWTEWQCFNDIVAIPVSFSGNCTIWTTKSLSWEVTHSIIEEIVQLKKITTWNQNFSLAESLSTLSNNYIRGRPLMIWGGAEEKSKMNFLFFPRDRLSNFFSPERPF